MPVHDIASSMGQQKSRALLAFYAFTGSDQTSSFANNGKKTARDTWAICDEVMEAFRYLSTTPSTSAVTDAFPVLERYTVLLYDRTSPCTSVNDARKDLFTCKGRDIDHIPPTGDALPQHAKRAAFLAGHCWGKCLEVSSFSKRMGLGERAYSRMGTIMDNHPSSIRELSRTLKVWL